MNFSALLEDIGEGNAFNPWAGKSSDGEWIAGGISIDFLNANFGQYSNAQEMIDATTSEGLKLFFGWLRKQGSIN